MSVDVKTIFAVGTTLYGALSKAWSYYKALQGTTSGNNQPDNDPPQDQAIALRSDQLESMHGVISELNERNQQLRVDGERARTQNSCLKGAVVALVCTNAMSLTALFWRYAAPNEAQSG